MNLKKFAGYLLAVLTLCSPATTVSEAADVEEVLSSDNLSYPATSFDGSGNSIHSTAGNQYTLGGGDLTLENGSTMTIYDVNVTNNIIAGTADLLLGTGATNGTTLGTISGSAAIQLQGARNITFTQAVAAKSLAMSNTATVSLQNSLTLTGGSYSQSSGTVQLGASKTISANSINTTGGTIQLGNGATLTTTGTGNIAFANTNVTNAAGNGSISAGGAYSQSGTSVVAADSLAAGGNVTLSGGQTTIAGDITGGVVNITNTTSATNIGTNLSKVTSYEQGTGADVTLTGDINSNGTVQVNGGDLTAVNIKAGGAYSQAANTTVVADNITAGGNVTLTGGQTTVTNNITGAVVNITNTTSANNIGTTSNKVTSYTQNTGANVTLTGDINSTGDVTVTAGALSAANIKTSNGAYSQATTGTVDVTGGNIETKNGISVSNGSLKAHNLTASSGAYSQTTGGKVTATGDLAVSGNITLAGGETAVTGNIKGGTVTITNKTSANNIGIAGQEVTSYTQNTGANVSITGDINSTGAVLVNAGPLNAANVKSASGGYSQSSGDKVTLTGDIAVAGDVTLSAGETEVAGNITGANVNVSNTTSANNIGTSSLKITSYTQNDTGADVTLTGDINSTGDVKIQKGKFSGKNIKSSGGKYTQETSEAVTLTGGSIETSGDVTISSGDLSAANITSTNGKYEQTTGGTVNLTGDLSTKGNIVLTSGTTTLRDMLSTNGGALTVSNHLTARNIGTSGSKMASYTQNTGAVTSFTGAMYTTGDVEINAGSLTSGDIYSGGIYSQVANTTVSVNANKGISAASVNTTGGTLNLGNASSLSSTTGAVSIKDTTVTDASNNASISAANGYTQSGSADVKVKNLSTTAGDVTISGGVMNAGSVNSAGKFTQTSNNTIVVGGDLTAGDKVSLSAGQTNVTGDIKTTGAVEITNTASAKNIGTSGSKVASYTQGTGSAVSLTGDMYSAGTVAVNAGSLNAKSINADGAYTQGAGIVTIDANKGISAASVTTTGGTINLGYGSFINSTTGAVSFTDTTVTDSTDNASVTAANGYSQSGSSDIKLKSLSTTAGDVEISGGVLSAGSVTSAGKYTQTTGNTITISGDLTAGDKIMLTSGKTNVTNDIKTTGAVEISNEAKARNIGLSGSKIASYNQKTGSTVVLTGDINSAGNVAINGGSLTANSVLSDGVYSQAANTTVGIAAGKTLSGASVNTTGGTINLGNGSYFKTTTGNMTLADTIVTGSGIISSEAAYTQTGSSNVAGASITAGGNVNLTGGSTTLTGDIKGGAVTVSNTTSAHDIGTSGTKVTSYTQNTGATVNLTGDINSTGNVAVNGGTLSVSGISSGGVYSQAEDTTVGIAAGKSLSAASVNTTGGTINLGNSSTFKSTTGNMTLANTAVNGSNASITSAGSYTQSGTSNVNINSLSTTSTSTGDVNVSGGTLSVGTLTSKKDLTVSGANTSLVTSGKTTVTGALSQTGGTITSASSDIDAASVSLTGGKLNIGSANDSATLRSTSGDITIGNVTINGDVGNKGTIESANGYIQNNSGAKVKIKKLLAKTASITGGTLNADNIGDNTEALTSYSQDSGSKVNTGNLYANTVTIDGAATSLSASNVYSSTGATIKAGTVNIASDLNTGTLSVQGGTLDAGSITATGNVSLTGGVTTVTTDLLSSGTVSITDAVLNAANIGSNQKRVTSYSQGTNASVTLTGNLYATGDVAVNAGSLTLGDINSSNGVYSQGAGSLVTIADGNKITAKSVATTGGQLNLGTGSSLTSSVEGISLANTIVNGSSGSIVANGAYSQTGSSSVEVSALTTKSTTTGDVTIGGGSLNVGKLTSAKDLTVSGGTLTASDVTNVTGTLSQTGGTITSASSNINAGTVALSGGDLNIGSVNPATTIKSTGSFTVSGTATINKGGSKAGIVDAASYTQSGADNKVYLNKLLASSGANVSDGTLSVNYLGDSTNKAQSYTQTGGDVTIGNLYTTKDVLLSGGKLTLDSYVDVGGDFTVSGVGTQFVNNINNPEDFNVAGTFNQGTGTEVIIGNGKTMTVGSYDVGAGSGLYLLQNASISTTKKFSVSGGIVSDEDKGGNGTGEIKAGEQYLQTAGTVTMNKITANTNNGQVNVQGGNLTASSVGTAGAKVNKFSQTGGTATITDVYATNAEIKNMIGTVDGITNITTDNYNQEDVAVELNNLSTGNLSVSKTVRDTSLTVNKTLTMTGTGTVDNSTLNILEKLNGNGGRLNIQNNGLLSLSNSGTITLTDFYVTDSGIDLGSNSSITANELVFTDAEIKLGDKSKLTGGISLWNTSSINQTSKNKYGIIESSGYYNQSTSGKVYVDQIFASGVSIDGSELHVNDIGTTANKITTYNQKNNAVVEADKIFVTNNVAVTGGTLKVNAIGSSGHKIDAYAQSDDVVQVDIGTGGIHATHGVQVNAGKMVLNGDVNAEIFNQSAESDVDLKDGKKINAKTVGVTESSVLKLGDNSQIVATENVSVLNSAKITDVNGSAVIDITGNYAQNGLNTDVQVKDLKATGNVDVQSGKLTVSNIGLATAKANNYIQGSVSAAPTVSADYMYLANTATINNGSLTLNKLLKADSGVNIYGGSVDIKENLQTGNIYQEAGTLTIEDNASATATNSVNFTKNAKVVLGDNAELTVNEGAGTIGVNNGASINKDSMSKKGTVQAASAYTQADSASTVYANKILATTVNAFGGSLNTNYIGTSDNYATSYNQSVTDTGVTDVHAENIYAVNTSIYGGTLTLGENSPSAILSSTQYTLNGGTVNLYNTTFKAPSSADETSTKVDINGATLNLYGNNTIGLYDTSKNIYTANIGTAKETNIIIGDGDPTITDTLDLSAGAGNFIIGQYAATNVNTDGILNLTAAKGNLIFDNNSSITNKGQINIFSDAQDKRVELSKINTDISYQGAITNYTGNVLVKNNIYTDTYNQAGGSTTINSGVELLSSSTGNGVVISGGDLVLNGAKAKVSVENGTFKTENAGTKISVTNKGTETAIVAKTISIDKTAIEADDSSEFKLDTNGVDGGSITVTGSTIDAKGSSQITIVTENATASISDSALTADGQGSALNLQGGTTITNSQLEAKNGGGINLDTTNGNITLNADTSIKNNGEINVTGDANIATINSVINSDGSKIGVINKTEANKLVLGTTVNANSINLTNGTTEANGNINLSGNFVIEGNTQEAKVATFELTEGNTLQSDSSVILGSLTNYASTNVILDNGSKIIAQDVSINSGLDMTKATIQANNNVVIGQKADITVKHYAGDGDNVTKSTIQGSNIYLSGGANITVKDKARLEYIGNIISDDTHYTIEKGATWDVNSGTYTNAYYEELPGGGMLTNAGDVLLSNNVNFQNSKAKYNGGAVYNTGNLKAKYNPEVGLWADNISFIGNKAGYSPSGLGDGAMNGGALYNAVATDTTNGIVLLGDTTTFAGNVASGSGGGLYNISGDNLNESAVKIGKYTNFNQNVSKLHGGAIYAGGTGTVQIGESSNFNNNLAGFANPSEYTGSAFGQPSYLAALSDGGAVAVDSDATVYFGHRANFVSNTASRNGGAISNAGTIYFNLYTDEYGNPQYNPSTENKAFFRQNGFYNGSGNPVRTAKGGAIYNTGKFYTVKEDGSTFEGLYKIHFGGESKEGYGNTAVKGGAIYNKLADDETLAIQKSTFWSNYAEEENGGDGGAIYNESGIVQIQTDTLFMKNTANYAGGAIYNSGTLVMDEGTKIGDYENGNVAKLGGGIYNTSNLSINATKDNRVEFIENAGLQAGGALYNDSPNVANIQYVDFLNNRAGDETQMLEGKGGAIYNAQGTINLSNSNIRENYASYNDAQGGGIYNANGATVALGDKTVISNNGAYGSNLEKKIYAQGGGIYNAGNLSVLNTNVAIQHNTTDGLGGGIYNKGNVTFVNGAVIGGTKDEYYQEKSPTEGNSALRGGGIYNDGGTLTFGDEVYFLGNTANLSGGGLHYKGGDLDVNGAIFYGNKAVGKDEEKGYGGGLYNDAASTGTVTVQNSTFIGNAADAGSAVYNAGNMYIDREGHDSTMEFAKLLPGTNYFKGNEVGSAIGNEGTLELASTFEFGHKPNSITPNAGAIANIGAGVVNIHETPTETSTLPAMYIHNVGNINGTGYGVLNGAALHLGYKGDDETANDGTATINTEVIDGGPTVLNDTIAAAYFEDNTGIKGGALYKDTKTDLTISQYHKYFAAPTGITKATFQGNIAASSEKDESGDNMAAGGAIYNKGKDADNKSNIIIDGDVTFWQNATTGKGGAIYNGANGAIEFAPGYYFGENTSGFSNTAEEGGGAIANEGNLVLNIDKDSNRSIYFTYQGGESEVKRTFDDSKYYSDKGGALYISGKGTVTTYDSSNNPHSGILNAVFTHNEAKNGGALYVDRKSEYVLNVTDTSFSGNRGYISGGAIYNDGEIHLTMSETDDNVFTGNQAGNEFTSLENNGKGGAIYNSNVMTIARDKDADSEMQEIFVSNRATGAQGSGGAIYNTSKMDIYGGMAFVNNEAGGTGGAITNTNELNLHLSRIISSATGDKPVAADIVFSQNTAPRGSAIYLAGGVLTIDRGDLPSGGGTVTFVDANEEDGTIAQTIAGEGKLIIKGGNVNFFSDTSGLKGAYQQVGGTVTVKNKFMNIEDSSIRAVTGGTFILDEGAQLTSNQLLVSNVEQESDNSAKIIFNSNTKAKLTDLTALYDNSSTFNTFTYTNTDDLAEHKIALRAADVEINDTATIDQNATIGNSKNKYMVRNLTLSNGATLDANITVYGGETIADVGAALIMNEGAVSTENASVNLKGYNSDFIVNNSDTDILISDIKNDGAGHGNKFEKTGAGEVKILGDASGFNGTYKQDGGVVEFTQGSKFFGVNTTTNVISGELKIAKDVEFEPGSVINFTGADATFSTDKTSAIDLTTPTATIVLPDDGVTVNTATGTSLEVTGNSTVNATMDEVKIGNAGQKINGLVLGDAEVTVNPSTKFILQNDSGTPGDGGILGFGDNVTFEDTAGNVVVPTVQLKDNTQLKLTNSQNVDYGVKIQNVDGTGTPVTAWADTNGDIVKENPGKATLSGDISDFHGTLVVKNGEIDTATTKFAPDVKFDLSKLEVGAKANVTNVTQNDDMTILGGIKPENTTSSVTVNVANATGDIYVRNAADTANGDVYLPIASKANMTAMGDIVANNLDASAGSEILMSAKGNAVSPGDIFVNNADVTTSHMGMTAKHDINAANVTVQGTSDAIMVAGGNITLNDLVVDNSSEATLEAALVSANNVYVRDTSVLNLNNQQALNVANNLELKNSIINLMGGDLNIAGNYTMGSTVNMMNGAFNQQYVGGNMTLTNDSDYMVDINPLFGWSDKVVVAGNLSSDTLGTPRKLNISQYNLLTEPQAEISAYKIFDVQGTVTDVEFTTSNEMVTTPIANYLFAPMGNTGSYSLIRTGYTPTAMAAPAAMQLGGYLSQIQVYDEALGNMDTVMVLPTAGGYYGGRKYGRNIDEAMVFAPVYIPELDKGIWFRPYGNFEKVDLQDGPNASNQTYGALVGGETALTELGNDFQGTLGAYIGYTGAHQSFDGISGNQNGGVVGLTGALYKGGFFSGLTVNADAGFSNVSTPYGKNDFFMLAAGVASKTGYNWELANGRFIIQPSWLMSYTFVNAFNPSDIAGRSVDAQGLHGVQLVPGLKLMANLPYGWQPYMLVDFRLNLGDRTHFKVSNSSLPEQYVKSYVEYGLGMQKRWGDRFTGYGQFLARNGGRNGVGVNLGLRWSVGQGR